MGYSFRPYTVLSTALKRSATLVFFLPPPATQRRLPAYPAAAEKNPAKYPSISAGDYIVSRYEAVLV